MKYNVKKYIRNGIVAFVAPILTFYLSELMPYNPFKSMKLPLQFLNIVLYEIIMLLLVAMIGRIRYALMIEISFFALWGILNYYLMRFRSKPFLPWDISSISTAVNVARNYSYALDHKMKLLICGFLGLLLVEFLFTDKECFLNWMQRLSGIVVMCVCLYGFTLWVQKGPMIKKYGITAQITPGDMMFRDGSALLFLWDLKFMFVEKPKGYNREDVEEMLVSYEIAENMEEDMILPNIIVIMDEAFSDLAVLADFETNQDYMPFLHSLMQNGENTKSGYLHVSVLGGNTANTEFEFLTGNSMSFLPSGSVPYMQYITSEIPTLATYLKEYGYATIGMHPYNAGGWKRNTLYPLMGLDNNYFDGSFEESEIVRRYISDKADFEKIKELYEQKEADKPLFLFNVTMQNHSSYTKSYDNFTPEISTIDIDSDALDNYLSLIYLSDKALGSLISYFEQIEEPTIIVFFGDHQPADSVVRPIWELNGISDDSLTEEETARRYEVPYIIWTNYESEVVRDKDISANFLAAEVLETAGIPQSAYTAYLSELSESFPVVSAIQAISADGEVSLAEEQIDAFLTYRKLQYYNLFDHK